MITQCAVPDKTRKIVNRKIVSPSTPCSLSETEVLFEFQISRLPRQR